MSAKKSLQERIAQYTVRRPSGCLEWIGSNVDGYGQTRINDINYLVHRKVYEEAHGPIPPGIEIMHKCDNPPCCELSHLVAGTHAGNMQDMLRKGRRGPGGVKGQRHHAAALTEEQVELIRLQKGEKLQRELAEEFGVSRRQIGKILDGSSWRA